MAAAWAEVLAAAVREVLVAAAREAQAVAAVAVHRNLRPDHERWR